MPNQGAVAVLVEIQVAIEQATADKPTPERCDLVRLQGRQLIKLEQGYGGGHQSAGDNRGDDPSSSGRNLPTIGVLFLAILVRTIRVTTAAP